MMALRHGPARHSFVNDLEVFFGMKNIRHFLSSGSNNLVTGDGHFGFKLGQETLAARDHDVPEAMTPFRKSIHDWTQRRMTQEPPLCEAIVNLSDCPVEGYLNRRSLDTWIEKIWK